jgi:hypothetical protein
MARLADQIRGRMAGRSAPGEGQDRVAGTGGPRCRENGVFCPELVPSGGPVPGFPCYLRGRQGGGRGRGPRRVPGWWPASRRLR